MVIDNQYPLLSTFALLCRFCFRIDHKVCSQTIASGLALSIRKLFLELKGLKLFILTINPDSHWNAPHLATPVLLRSKVQPDLRLLFRSLRSKSGVFPLRVCTRKRLLEAVAKLPCE